MVWRKERRGWERGRERRRDKRREEKRTGRRRGYENYRRGGGCVGKVMGEDWIRFFKLKRRRILNLC